MQSVVCKARHATFHRSRERGDTIVEVLIATAIISLVLVLAYATATRNARVAQETREQTQAVKIAERQVELLRNSNLTSPAVLPTAANPCYPVGATTPGAACDNFTADGSGATYQVRITPPTGTGDVYTVQVEWDTLAGRTANVTMRYIP